MRAARGLVWAGRIVALAALGVVGWVLLTAWGAVWHAHPTYPALLVLTALGALLVLVLWVRQNLDVTEIGVSSVDDEPRRHPTLRAVGRAAAVLAAAAWVVAAAWLRPFGAQQAALEAMESDPAVTVSESATQIILTPADGGDGPALFFQPGARVDARAYVATLRPIAEAGTPVVIAKQPFGIAFFALGAYDGARTAVEAPGWVVGGHSLGGTVAAMTAESGDDIVGLVLWASYPAGDESTLDVPVLSVSGSQDGLATPADIDASRANLPADTEFVVVDGASHASFADYGPQPGDGTPTLDGADARTRIATATEEFLAGLP
ncbi:alpha/beta hydrolase [Actinotalea sp. M2MS4P-6]|uniref:alpha/beta hydrolase n=1 Tax=Actinotalea sp. M2MS4P-6 TaxID=2983762 RepID=UPI0021E42B22|nr:alpha/beta hydrolase [Actinotalea sp. M2MS4P-6]MCV2393632.1 alpha/beta hydrolase [Actinotalea sp. M2MS4P-6]